MTDKVNIIFFCRNSEKKIKSVVDAYRYIAKFILNDFNVNIIYYGSYLHRFFLKFNIEVIFIKLIKIIYNPKLLIFIDEGSSLNFATSVRKYMNSPTINLSHAMVSDHAYYKNIDFNYYLIYGQKCKESIKKFNVNCNKTEIIPIGPLYSAVRAMSSKRESKDLIKLTKHINKTNSSKFKSRICITSQWWQHSVSYELIPIYTQLKEFITKRKDLLFYIKPHPLEADYSNPLAELEGSENVEVLSKDSSVADLFGFVDLHLTVYSNSIIDFSLFNIPSVFLGFDTNRAFQYGVVPRDYKLICFNIGELEEIIDQGKYSYIDVGELLFHNTDGVGFESIDKFKYIVNKIIKMESVSNECQF